jgi:hypothetical protein
MVSALSACAHLGAYDSGRSVHAAALNAITRTSLVDMYAKCGSIEKAAAAFYDASAGGEKNVWTYSVMVSSVRIDSRLFCRSTVGYFADQPSETNTGDET